MSRITESLYRVNGIELDNKLRTNNRKVKKTLNESKKLTEDVDESTLEGCQSYIDNVREKILTLADSTELNIDPHFDSAIFETIFEQEDFYNTVMDDDSILFSCLEECDGSIENVVNFISSLLDDLSDYLVATQGYLQDHWDEF